MTRHCSTKCRPPSVAVAVPRITATESEPIAVRAAQVGNISAPVFAASSPQQFFALLASRQPDPVTRKADPARVKAFNDAHPEVLLQGKYFASQPVPASFSSVNCWGVHGYGFVNARGATQFGKWIFEPVGGVYGLTDDEAKARGPSFLFDDLRRRVQDGKVAFNFNLELAQQGGRVDNATIPLPEGRRKVTLGTLKVTSVSEDAGGPCLGITYDPTVMPRGVLPSSDPLLPARSAPYAISLGRRLTEGAKQQSGGCASAGRGADVAAAMAIAGNAIGCRWTQAGAIRDGGGHHGSALVPSSSSERLRCARES
jgi:hypothetical protein